MDPGLYTVRRPAQPVRGVWRNLHDIEGSKNLRCLEGLGTVDEVNPYERVWVQTSHTRVKMTLVKSDLKT